MEIVTVDLSCERPRGRGHPVGGDLIEEHFKFWRPCDHRLPVATRSIIEPRQGVCRGFEGPGRILELRSRCGGVSTDAAALIASGDTLGALLVTQQESEAGGVIEARRQPTATGEPNHGPVVLMAIGVADEGVEKEVSGEPLEGAGQRALGVRRCDAVEYLTDGSDRVARPVMRLARSDAGLAEEFIPVDQTLALIIKHRPADDPERVPSHGKQHMCHWDI
jgi:hypothetical protein